MGGDSRKCQFLNHFLQIILNWYNSLIYIVPLLQTLQDKSGADPDKKIEIP